MFHLPYSIIKVGSVENGCLICNVLGFDFHYLRKSMLLTLLSYRNSTHLIFSAQKKNLLIAYRTLSITNITILSKVEFMKCEKKEKKLQIVLEEKKNY